MNPLVVCLSLLRHYSAVLSADVLTDPGCGAGFYGLGGGGAAAGGSAHFYGLEEQVGGASSSLGIIITIYYPFIIRLLSMGFMPHYLVVAVLPVLNTPQFLPELNMMHHTVV